VSFSVIDFLPHKKASPCQKNDVCFLMRKRQLEIDASDEDPSRAHPRGLTAFPIQIESLYQGVNRICMKDKFWSSSGTNELRRRKG
jgi:hypothetical protein